MKADLHLHTHYSDGTESPAHMVASAKDLGFDVVAITDHDTMGGVSEALEAGEELGVRVVPGVELTAQFHRVELHLLAYFPDAKEEGQGWRSEEFLGHLREYAMQRRKRAEKMVKKLNDIGVPLTMEDVEQQRGNGEQRALGRPHIAAALVAKDIVSDLDEAFSGYLKKGGKAWVDKMRSGTQEVIDLVHRAGGIISLAHPGLLREIPIPRELCSEGMDAVEVYHSRHTSHQSAKFRKWAEEHDLIVTGGSDCHGMLKGEPLIGRVELKDRDLERFLAKLE